MGETLAMRIDHMMKRLSAVFAIAAIMSLPATQASALLPLLESQPDGVYCEINGVKLFAETAEDCKKAEGKVTHSVKTTVAPVDDKSK